MSWDELQTRVRQEVFQAGRRSLVRDWATTGPERPARHFRAARTFLFFSEGELAKRVSLLREHCLARRKKIVAEANEICRHRFRLLGYARPRLRQRNRLASGRGKWFALSAGYRGSKLIS